MSAAIVVSWNLSGLVKRAFIARIRVRKGESVAPSTAVLKLRARLVRKLTTPQRLKLRKLRHGEFPWQQSLRKIVAMVAPFQGSPPPAYQISRCYDARRFAAENLRAVREAISATGEQYVILPSEDVYNQVVVIARDSLPAVQRALTMLDSDLGWRITTHYRALPSEQNSATQDDRKRTKQITRMTAGRVIASPNGRRLSTFREFINVQVWRTLSEDVERADGETHLAGTLHATVGQRIDKVTYLTPQQIAAAQQRKDHRLDLGGPLLTEITEPIDLVYTWVNGEDPEWLKRKVEALGSFDSTEVNATALAASRFVDREELKYSLRSVEMYASWARHIYIVTDNQVPTWLNVEHPKITVVDHKEIFSNTSVLPVYNSHAIESQLHHIHGLSDRYVYMNDDVFFCRPTTPTLFFTSSGLSKFFLSRATLDIDQPSARDMPVLSAAKHNREFVLSQHGRVVTRKFKHTPHPQIKAILEDLETENSAMFERAQASRVRHPDDNSIASALYHYHAYALGKAVPANIRYGYLDIAREDAELRLSTLSRRRDLDVLCLNDTNTHPSQRPTIDRLLVDFLENQFPVPSSYEVSSP